MRFIAVLFALLLWFSPISSAFALCYITDVECTASDVLPGYDPDKDSVREWSSSRGKMVAQGNYILAKIRFDDESLSVLRNGRPYGIEIEAVISGANYNQVSLASVYHTFPSSAQAGVDTQVLDFLTNDAGTKVLALHVLNVDAIEKDTDYYVIFFLENQLPTGGVMVSPNLQITIDEDYTLFLSTLNFLIDAFDLLNQFQHYVLETDFHEPFIAYPNKYQGTCWDNKANSYHCPGSGSPPSGTLAVNLSGSDAPLVSSASSVQSNYGGYAPPTGTTLPPIPGPRVDLRPDFDVYDTDGHEVSANCDDCSGKPLDVGQTIRPKLWIQVSNDDAGNFKRNSNSDTIEGPVWWMIEGVTGWNFLASGEYTIGKLDEGEQISETHTWAVPNYPGSILAMKVCVDGDDEIWEEDENSGSGHDIDNPDQSGTTNNCSRRERFPIKYPNYTPTGVIESADCSLIKGWAKDQNTPSSLAVQVYTSNPDGSNMQYLDSAVASVDRSDIGGRYGLEWMVPDSLIDGVARSVHFYAVNIPEGTNVLIGSVPLTCLPKTPAELSAEESAIWLILQP